jgi:hypothetical protein
MTIAPSPVQREIIWVGTDDGNVQVTQDGGRTWTNTVSRIPDVPRNSWVPHIEASKHEAGTAYVVFDDHRRSNWKTYIYKTDDFGKSWRSLAKNDPTKGTASPWGYALVLEQDPVRKELLYLGTEFGLWISFDDGNNWMKWTKGFPTVSTMALMVHPRDNDLVIGTHGRSAYILDDVTPLRMFSKELAEKPLVLFPISPAQQHQLKQMDGYHFPGDAMFRGDNRPYGAMITYSVNPPAESKEPARGEEIESSGRENRAVSADSVVKKKMRIQILDSTGAVIRSFDGPMEKGLNRAVWNLRRDAFKRPQLAAVQAEGFSPGGPEVPAGRYVVRMKMGETEVSQALDIRPDPRVPRAPGVQQKQYETIIAASRRLEVAAEAVERIQKTRRAIDLVMSQIADRKDAVGNDLKRRSSELRKSLTRVATLFLDDPSGTQGSSRSPNTVSAKLGGVVRSLSTSWDVPSPTQLTYLRQAEMILEKALSQFNKLFAEDVAAYRAAVDQAKLALVPEFSGLDVNWMPPKKD